MRKDVAGATEAMPVSVRVTPPNSNEKIAETEGIPEPGLGAMVAFPPRTWSPVLDVATFVAYFALMEYEVIVPSIVTFPAIGSSVGLTSTICVIHPAPATKSGKTTGVCGLVLSGTIGSVVRRKTPRSLIKPRIAVAPTGTDDVNVKDCAGAEPLKGS